MNLTGQWQFFEQFDAGFDMGHAVLTQIDDRIVGTLIYTEYIYEETSFLIQVEVEGEVIEDTLMFVGKSYEILESPYEIDYCLDERIAELHNPNRIEGHSVDDQDLEGRFILRRLEEELC